MNTQGVMEKQDKVEVKGGNFRKYTAILITICLIMLTLTYTSSSTPQDLQNLVTTPTTEQYMEVTRRDDSSESSSSSTLETTSKPLLKQPGIQFALAFAGFIVLNMIAICIHHLYHIASRSTKSYRNVQQDISPF